MHQLAVHQLASETNMAVLRHRPGMAPFCIFDKGAVGGLSRWADDVGVGPEGEGLRSSIEGRPCMEPRHGTTANFWAVTY